LTPNRFVEKAFKEIGILINWEGRGINEVGIISDINRELSNSDNKDSIQLKPGDVVVQIDPQYFRPTEVDFLLGDASRAREKLGWEAVVSFDELVKLMIDEDLKEAKKDHLCNNAGFPVYNHSE